MATKTGIGWTQLFGSGSGSTWNPIRAKNRENNKTGWACTKVSDGCKFCYAEELNVGRFGTGLDYTVPNLQKIELHLAGITTPNNGQTAIDWPLRAKKSQGIFPCSMTDWLGEFVPASWSNLMLGVMLLAQHHVFLPLTKRHERLAKLLTWFSNTPADIIVPDTKTFDIAILKAIGNSKHWQGGKALMKIRNSKYVVATPWPPPNIYFGMSIVNQKEADDALQYFQAIKQLSPAFQTWISYEPALENIEWNSEYGWVTNWVVWGGESGKKARPATMDSALKTIDFFEQHGIPVYIKQTGSVLAKELGLEGKGESNLPEPYNVRQFPNFSKSYIPWR